MGKVSKKIILTLITKWRSLIVGQTDALSKGDLDQFELLNKKSVAIQAQLDKILLNSDTTRMDKEVLDSMQELHALHSGLVDGLIDGTKELSERIGLLRKNKTSLKGYKQQKISVPRFMSERT
jgi:hypothetical protein